MGWLLALPVWVILWSVLLSPDLKSRKNAKAYMVICSLALIFVLGLRSRYTGSMDTYMYSLAFNSAKNYSDLYAFLEAKDVFDGFFLLSEGGFHLYTWLAAQIFPEAQWFILLSAVIIVSSTASFIWNNSEDLTVSWIVFICLGSMTFAINGMRQALAMSICLLSYRYAKEKKLFRFLLIVLIAILFHKSAVVFLLVYIMRNMKLDFKSVAFLSVLVVAFLVFADRFAFLYDSMTGEDYAIAESFEGGGAVAVAIYVCAIIMLFVCSKRLKQRNVFVPLSLTVFGLVLYLARFTSVQIYERISYYFAYFLMLVFPSIFKDLKKEFYVLIKVCFFLAAIVLFAYRISKGAFADFAMFW